MEPVIRLTLGDGALLPPGALGVDAGLTLTKLVWRDGDAVEAAAYPTASVSDALLPGAVLGVTGARAAMFESRPTAAWSEIDTAVHGVRALAPEAPAEFLLALLGTGTLFAVVRGDSIAHVGGTALGGGSFTGIAGRMAPDLAYGEMVAGAARGERRNADLLVSDAYPGGIGRIGGDLTAAHLAKHGGSLDDVLASVLNLHGENIAQIAASRALTSRLDTIVLAGGFAQDNAALVTSITAMVGLFGMRTVVSPAPGFAGALGAAMLALRERSDAASPAPGGSS
jgi:type II pantothenate kinase